MHQCFIARLSANHLYPCPTVTRRIRFGGPQLDKASSSRQCFGVVRSWMMRARSVVCRVCFCGLRISPKFRPGAAKILPPFNHPLLSMHQCTTTLPMRTTYGQLCSLDSKSRIHPLSRSISSLDLLAAFHCRPGSQSALTHLTLLQFSPRLFVHATAL